ncbi:sensor histidine kinase [Nocardioides currus]|uniref:Sensor-like histidine kinase SenX3 n=1 Tax=Nocardioides currus TaxID=2133958 RepID=A0A2R7Z3K7_9ACTN|nr:ATP-binding protein [Nocardioides currus]PUA82926.1 hypothetical protein C7S10_04320 [Nocardioides currus]
MTSQGPISATDLVRPRRHGWGDVAARTSMAAIAERLRVLGGFESCAIEVLRGDGMLEFVAIATDNPVTRSERDGTGSPLSAMYPALDQGVVTGALRFLRAEDMTREAFENLAPYSVFPDIARHEDRSRWHREDMLIAEVRDDEDRLRGLIYLDNPLDGKRPSAADLVELDRVIRPALHLALVQIEREEFAQRIRISSATRAVVRSASPSADLRELLSTMREEFREPFRAHGIWIATLDSFDGELIIPFAPGSGFDLSYGVRAAMRAAMTDAWARQEVLIIDSERVWGDDVLDEHYRDSLTPHVTERGLREVVLVPVGAGATALGMLAVARDADGPRWTDDESSAALDVAHDLGRAILNAQANEREHAVMDQLREVGDHRRSLIDLVARELQNPLALVAGHLELLDAMELPEDARRSVVPMIRNTARLTSLAQDLALVSRLADSTGAVSEATLDLAELAAEAVEAVRPMAAHRDVRIVQTVVGTCHVHGHPLELSRCIGGLLDNAVKFSHLGGTVEVELRGDDQQVELSVRDHGIGISSTDQGRLFGEFFRSDDPAALSRSGYGLGLTIARQVAVRHGGTITVESARGAGATFRLVVPQAAPESLTTTW